MRSLLLALLALVATVSSVGCSYRNEDINRVVQPYWAKAYFTDDNEWYARATVVDAPPEHGWVSIGDGDWLMLDKLRWEVTETELIGWRTYASATGAENEQLPGGQEIYKGQAVARFAVTDHFDIRRDFDPTSGEQANTIGENRDRLWYDREFFRVNWSRNLVETYRGYVNMNTPYGLNLTSNGAGESVVYGSDAPAQPKRWRFEADPETGVPTYFEITTRHEVEPDLYGLFGYYGALSGDSSAALIDVRYSFTRVAKSDYQALAMPPTVILEDEDGKEVRDEKGFAVRIPINDRFGFFGSLGRASFDANRGMISSGQLFNAARFNLWEKSVNDDGTVIPLEQREPKPEAIVYYGNVEHPAQLLEASQEVARQWNKVFRDTVYNVNKARYTGALDADGIPNDVPPMFVFKQNSCNVSNVESVLANLEDNGHDEIVDLVTKEAARVTVNNEVVPFDGTIASVRSRFDAANNGINNMQGNGLGPNGESFTQMQATESQALHDLERICAALEYYTGPDLATGRAAPEGVKQFAYQRLGDIRYSMMNLIVGDFQSGWLGLGPPYADPITGETISATANVSVGILDRGAARAAQMVQALNGENTELDFINGFDLKDYTNQKLLENSKMITRRASQQTKENVARTFAALEGREGALREMAPGRANERFSRLEGTEAEQKLITNDDLALFGAVNPADVATMTQTDALMEAASMVRNPSLRKLGSEAEARAIRMGNRAADAPEMIDSFMIGSALRYKDMSYAERFKKLRIESYISVELHEVGHNVGMFHNFAGSTDAINYGPKFWELHNLPADLNDAIDELSVKADAVSVARVEALENCVDAVEDAAAKLIEEAEAGNVGFGDFLGDVSTQECLTQSEGMYSSIMEYMGTWNSDFNGLGPYDFAANKFGYGQLLEVFPEANLAETQAPGDIKDRLFYDDWRTIPDLFVGATPEEKAEKIQQREYVKMNWTTSSTQQAPLGNEVPYRFGPGNYPEPLVRVYDFGPDTRTNASYQLTRYYQHYYFSHFARNRLWDYDAVNGPLSSDAGIFDDFTQKMQWFFFLSATDPKFKGSYAAEDYLATTTIGMNHFAHVLAEPNSGDFSTLPSYQLFGTTNLRPSERSDAPLNVAIPWSNFDFCTAVNINETDDFGTSMAGAKSGYAAGSVPLGEGRPFFVGFTDDYVDFYIRYVGHFWTKQYALIYLADSMAWFPRVDGDADFRTFDVGWYRLFPKEVAGIFSNLITQNDIGLGGYLDANGNYVRPDVVATDATPDTSSMTKVLPQIAFNHNYYAYVLANIYMSSTTDDTIDLPKMMQIAVDGGSDDVRAFDDAEARDAVAGCELSDDPTDPFDQYDDLTSPPACKTVLSFTHPASGLTYRALKVGDTPIAFDLVKRLNVLKERFERLQTCGEQLDAGVEVTDSYCACISSASTVLDQGDLGTACSVGFATVMPGEVVTLDRAPGFGGGTVDMTCDDVDLFNRIEGARESLDDYVDYVNDLRTYNKLINNF
jgi:hypothetical protein